MLHRHSRQTSVALHSRSTHCLATPYLVLNTSTGTPGRESLNNGAHILALSLCADFATMSRVLDLPCMVYASPIMVSHNPKKAANVMSGCLEIHMH